MTLGALRPWTGAVQARPIAAFVLPAVAIGLTLLRLLDLGTAPFIQDEPSLQLMIDEHWAAHTLPTHGVMGTKGLAYGPTAIWLYVPVRLLTDKVPWIIGAHALLQCAGFVLMVLAVRASAGKETALWTWLLVAASPYLFFYARLAWDNTFLVPLVAAVLFLVVAVERRPRSVGAWVGLGVVCGLIFDLHLMALPVIAAAAITAAPLAWRTRHSRSVQAGVLCATLAATGIVAPYLRDVSGVLFHGSQLAFTMEGLTRVVPEILDAMRRYPSAEGMDYFLDQTDAVVLKNLGPIHWGFALGWAVAIAGFGCLISSTFSLLRAAFRGTPHAPLPIVARFGVTFFWLFLFYYYGVRPYPFHPHYVIAAFWILPFFAAWSLIRLPRALRLGVQGAMAALAISDAAFVLAAHAQIARNHGTRTDHYGSIPSEVETATDEICRAARAAGKTVATVDLRRVPGVLPLSFKWFDHHLHDCAGVDLAFGPRWPPDAPFRIVYGDASPYDARLRVIGPVGP